MEPEHSSSEEEVLVTERWPDEDHDASATPALEKWVYVVANAEPDADIESVWESQKDAEAHRAKLHARWPGMGFYVKRLGLHPGGTA